MTYDIKFFEEKIYKNSNRLKEKFISKNFNGFYNFILNEFEGSTFLEKLFIFYKGHALCYCGHKPKFINFKKGYLKYCSIKCSSNNKEVREKYKKTCINKYGVDNVSKSDSIKNSKEITNLKRHGVKTFLQTKMVNEIINEKYGVDNVFELDFVKIR